MKKIISMVLIVATILGCCATLTGCGSSRSKDHKYGYYDRADGNRIWFEK